MDTVQADSLITLHYRVASVDKGVDDTGAAEMVSTFDRTPATLQLGNNELAPTLEQCIIGIAVGERRSFLLEPEQAFGSHNPQLMQRMPRSEVPASISFADRVTDSAADDASGPALHSPIEFTAPSGQKFTGIVRDMDAETLLVDFNHPLAGQRVLFEVALIGIL